MNKVLIVTSMVLLLLMISACSSDDNVFVPKDEDYVGYVSNKTGTVCLFWKKMILLSQ